MSPTPEIREYRAFMQACAGSPAVSRLWEEAAPPAEQALLETHLPEIKNKNEVPGASGDGTPNGVPGDSFLVAGCGPGREIPALLSRGGWVWAVDREPAMCQAVRERCSHPRLRVVEADLANLPAVCPAGRFGAALCLGLVSGGLFLPGGGASQALGALANALRPGGVLLLDFLAAPGGPDDCRVARFSYPAEAGRCIEGLCAWPSRALVRRTLFDAGFVVSFTPLLHDPDTPLVAAVARRPSVSTDR